MHLRALWKRLLIVLDSQSVGPSSGLALYLVYLLLEKALVGWVTILVELAVGIVLMAVKLYLDLNARLALNLDLLWSLPPIVDVHLALPVRWALQTEQSLTEDCRSRPSEVGLRPLPRSPEQTIADEHCMILAAWRRCRWQHHESGNIALGEQVIMKHMLQS